MRTTFLIGGFVVLAVAAGSRITAEQPIPWVRFVVDSRQPLEGGELILIEDTSTQGLVNRAGCFAVWRINGTVILLGTMRCQTEAQQRQREWEESRRTVVQWNLNLRQRRARIK